MIHGYGQSKEASTTESNWILDTKSLLGVYPEPGQRPEMNPYHNEPRQQGDT